MVRVLVSPGAHEIVHVPPTGLIPLQLDVSRPRICCPVAVVDGMLGHAHRGSCSLVVLSDLAKRLQVAVIEYFIAVCTTYMCLW